MAKMTRKLFAEQMQPIIDSVAIEVWLVRNPKGTVEEFMKHFTLKHGWKFKDDFILKCGYLFEPIQLRNGDYV